MAALTHRAEVEVVSSMERDGHLVFGDLRWGVYASLAADNNDIRKCFKE